MKKIKLFTSFLKERDWLEDMARKGFILKNITFGVLYDFEESTPAEKVYEIEKFSVSFSGNAEKNELNARKIAMDITKQTGWDIVTHDEELNYYFIKDKEGDGQDEFYEDEESRKYRANKYRKFYTVEVPKTLLSLLLIVSAIYLALFFFLRDDVNRLVFYMGLFIAVTILEVMISFFSICFGEKSYEEFILSREQWEKYKKYSEVKNFSKVKDLISFLQQKDHQGLMFVGCNNSRYLFDETQDHYVYYADTKSALKRRMKKNGEKLQREKKDLNNISTKWHEISIMEAESLGLELVCAVENGTIIYRKKSDNTPPIWDNSAIKTGYGENSKQITVFFIIIFIIGFVAGFLSKML